MTSQVNPYNIDGTYPIAGQDNDSQGFRDNFTNTVNNFAFVKAEIEDLQARAVLKSALSNSTLDNSMSYAKIVDAQLQSYSETFYSAAAGSYVVDYNRGNAQQITTTQSGNLTFQNWGPAGQLCRITLQVTVQDTAHKITLPASCVLGAISSIAGIADKTITYTAAGDYFYEFLSTDGGINVFAYELGRDSSIAAIASETAARIAGDESNATAITDEIANRLTGDATNAAAITAETARAENAEAILGANITSEATARVAGDSANTTAINTERTRAQTAEGALSALVASEAARATAAEGVITNSVTDEVARASAAEGALSALVASLTAEVQSLADRVTALEAANNPPANP